jgi:Protein of unknown function (DUF3048) N-terminal domain/Protein of unknown function (DUF3048) C-terminal domain
MVVLAVIAAPACSGGTSHVAATRPSTSSSLASTPLPQGPVFPLTDLAAPGGPPNRPALSVKIDNVDPARPQSGVNDADVVFEELVEGGNSRLFAVFQSHDSPRVGPIRSARPVDADLLHGLGGGIFAFSGAAAGELAPVKDHSGATLLSNDAGSAGFARDHSRQAPYNLYSSTAALYSAGASAGNHQGPPPGLFAYGSSAATAPATGVDLTFGIHLSCGWRWSAASHRYERSQNGTPDVLADGSPIVSDNLVIMSVQITGTGIFDSVHEEDPFVHVIGSGPAWVLRDGHLAAGQWARSGLDAPTVLTAAGGGPLNLEPGRTWVELLPVPNQPAFR